MNKIIYCFWTGNNEMSANRKKCLESLKKSQCEIKLITPNNLNNFIKRDYPLHKAYQYLSHTHKSDYLRCYFMHHYGGGYSDLKETVFSWSKAFHDCEEDLCYINGYQEIGPQGVASVGGKLQEELEKNYQKLLGCCSFICKKETPFTQDWISDLHNRLDNFFSDLEKHPATHPQEKPLMIINGNFSRYPIPWTNILGDIFHPLCLKYQDNIKQTVPKPLFTNYR